MYIFKSPREHIIDIVQAWVSQDKNLFLRKMKQAYIYVCDLNGVYKNNSVEHSQKKLKSLVIELVDSWYGRDKTLFLTKMAYAKQIINEEEKNRRTALAIQIQTKTKRKKPKK